MCGWTDIVVAYVCCFLHTSCMLVIIDAGSSYALHARKACSMGEFIFLIFSGSRSQIAITGH